MRISKTISSRLEAIPGVISCVVEKLNESALDKETISQVKPALQEAMVNAVKHGNKMDPALAVRVGIELEPEQLIIQVADEGEGYDYKNIPSPVEPQNLEKLKGRGIYLIKHLMDKVEFLKNGSTIRMIKYLKREAIEK
jgi:serine/threonine-protein kinase RsbW